jgi:hypothetical protein
MQLFETIMHSYVLSILSVVYWCSCVFVKVTNFRVLFRLAKKFCFTKT